MLDRGRSTLLVRPYLYHRFRLLTAKGEATFSMDKVGRDGPQLPKDSERDRELVPTVPIEGARKAFYRNHQSLHRERELGVPLGTDNRGRTIASLLPNREKEDPVGLNFLLDADIVEYVKARVAAVKNIGGTIDEDRLWRNMLSSMPVCFNLFGRLRQQTEIAARILQAATGRAIAAIDLLEVEWSEPHLGDKTAFDAYVEYRTPTGERGFIGIETKYTESFGRQEIGDRNIERYRQEADEICSDIPTDSQLKHQVWRNTLLASAHLSASDFNQGCSLVITLGDDREALREIASVRSHLKDPSFVRWTSYEAILADLEETEARDWAKQFRRRYLPVVPASGYERGKNQSSPVEPTEFEISLAGFGGPFYTVSWTGSALLYESGLDGSRESSEQEVNPTPQQWKSFWKKLDRIHFWKWPESFGVNAMDGRWWSVSVNLSGKKLKSEGTNAYPPDGKSIDPSREFRQFCRAVSVLVGQEFS